VAETAAMVYVPPSVVSKWPDEPVNN